MLQKWESNCGWKWNSLLVIEHGKSSGNYSGWWFLLIAGINLRNEGENHGNFAFAVGMKGWVMGKAVERTLSDFLSICNFTKDVMSIELWWKDEPQRLQFFHHTSVFRIAEGLDFLPSHLMWYSAIFLTFSMSIWKHDRWEWWCLQDKYSILK